MIPIEAVTDDRKGKAIMFLDQTGVTHHLHGKATPGYTLFSPTQASQVYLIDLDGQEVHRWHVTGRCTNCNMLLPNGNLFITEKSDAPSPIRVGGAGLLREYDWNSKIVWEHRDDMQHHDGRRLPNGGAVYLAWELLDPDRAASIPGGVPGSEHDDGIYGEVVREIDAAGKVVWEWRVSELDAQQYPIHRNAVRQIYGHANAIDVLPDGNYLISFKVLNLLVILDRASKKVVWEFQHDDLGGQHDVQMLPNGNILVFANGTYGSDLIHSSVWEIDPKTKEVVWKFTEKRNPLNFFSTHISGCQRLSSGNTLICEGGKGTIFEVTPDRDVVWQYISPYWNQHPVFVEINWIFRARRYAADSPQIQNRV